jgi:hypothetical protein
LPDQRQKVDEALSKVAAAQTALAAAHDAEFRAFQSSLPSLQDVRADVDGQRVEVGEIVEVYSGTVSRALSMNNAALTRVHDADLAKGGAALIQVSTAKEAAGLERAMATIGFGNGGFEQGSLSRFQHFGLLQKQAL